MGDILDKILIALAIVIFGTLLFRMQTCAALCEIPVDTAHAPQGAELRAQACAKKFGSNFLIWRYEGTKEGDK